MNAFDEKVRGIIDDTTPYINAVIRLITNTALESIEDAKINFSILDQEEKKERTATEKQISRTIVKYVDDAC
ncbi:MAG: hypothetical protein J5525_13290 [Lachnospiraceae bacterium]|nr:hypothetical protein [Lachnospiraceae bacterium]